MNVNKKSGVLHDDVISRDRDKINTTIERGKETGHEPRRNAGNNSEEKSMEATQRGNRRKGGGT